MKINVSQYSQALFELTFNKSEDEVKGVINDFLEYLIKNNDFFLLDKIVYSFNQLIKEASGELEIEIVSARPLSEVSDSSLKKYLAAKSGASDVKISENIDKDIIGGFILRYQDKVIDASLKHSLLSFQKQISN